MKLLTLNCQKGYRIEALKKFLKKEVKKSYDFLLLQEVDSVVRKALQEILPRKYKILRVKNRLTGEWCHNCIAYDRKFKAENKKFVYLQKISPRTHKGDEYGMTVGIFKDNKRKMAIASVHLHAIFYKKTRIKGSSILKREMMKIVKDEKTSLNVLGGDFNTIAKEEPKNHSEIMKPEFTDAVSEKDITYSTKYIEKYPIGNGILHLVAKIGLIFERKTDHVYVNCSKKYKAKSRVFRAGISDHLPIETEIKL